MYVPRLTHEAMPVSSRNNVLRFSRRTRANRPGFRQPIFSPSCTRSCVNLLTILKQTSTTYVTAATKVSNNGSAYTHTCRSAWETTNYFEASPCRPCRLELKCIGGRGVVLAIPSASTRPLARACPLSHRVFAGTCGTYTEG